MSALTAQVCVKHVDFNVGCNVHVCIAQCELGLGGYGDPPFDTWRHLDNDNDITMHDMFNFDILQEMLPTVCDWKKPTFTPTQRPTLPKPLPSAHPNPNIFSAIYRPNSNSNSKPGTWPKLHQILVDGHASPSLPT